MTNASAETAVVTSEAEEDAAAREFISELARQDTGRLAVLRRNAGNSISEARGVAWLYGLLSRYAKPRNEEAHFMIATLFASDKKTINDIIEGKNAFRVGNFGATLRALRSKSVKSPSDPSPLDRRFNILLDADFDPRKGGELAFRLRQMTKRVVSEKDPAVRINWAQLLLDAQLWNRADKRAHKRWARSYYAPQLSSEDDAQTELEKE